MDTRALSQIEIVYRNTAASLTYAQARSGKRFSLGCEERCDVVIHGDYVSRSHAYIEIDGSDFLLVDASTNGSFVQTEDEQVEFVHRGHIRL
ncbi:MAG: FHA domain-containing protein [Pseudomonadales bacterium]|nr:FHA domain-containing protein [Pseudomonadales bacterium]